ncbi:MFS transporter [Hymenobacter sp. BT186]|uniref:MFS transporter n=1 Tax=Hymenobacter telluris TaxID=2816474 RepID=A0A939EUN7_9BACT|nr:MFS transporter [Hymenobacter telluris]MBO0357306.1 MFS transporter [Hymenobacter telluris]MBW3373332.1 MFS transporter [Hymenobacter norwichensis]
MKSKLALVPLTLGGFGIGMTEFVMMGILPDIAKAMHITIPAAGHFISAYALGVVVGAPLLVALTVKMPPKRILALLMALFAFGNGLSVLASSYHLMLLTRFLSGLPHGAFFGVGAVVAGRLAEPGKEARAISMMFAGLTFANIIGVPIGTYLGHNYGWQIPFVLIVVVASLTVLSVWRWLPVLPAKETNLRQEFQAFRHLEPWMIIGITILGNGGFFAWFSYIVPLFTEVAGFSNNAVTFLMVLAGVGMSLGNLLGGWLTDRMSPLRATTWLLLAMTASLLLVPLAAQHQATTILITMLTGALAFSTAAPIQMLMIRSAKGSEMLASSLSQSGFNTGNALGAYLGGLPIAAGLGYTSPDWVGAALVLSGIAFCVALVFRRRNKVRVQLALQ